MARVTVEDCVTEIPNRFELVMIASQRARNVSAGAEITIDRDNDKNPVVALREIADKTVDLEELEESLVKSLQKVVDIDEPDESEMDMFAIPQSNNPVLADDDSSPVIELTIGGSDAAGDIMLDDDMSDKEELAQG